MQKVKEVFPDLEHCEGEDEGTDQLCGEDPRGVMQFFIKLEVQKDNGGKDNKNNGGENYAKGEKAGKKHYTGVTAVEGNRRYNSDKLKKSAHKQAKKRAFGSSEKQIAELANQLQISTTAVSNAIKTLKKKQLIDRKGSKKGGRWLILE